VLPSPSAPQPYDRGRNRTATYFQTVRQVSGWITTDFAPVYLSVDRMARLLGRPPFLIIRARRVRRVRSVIPYRRIEGPTPRSAGSFSPVGFAVGSHASGPLYAAGYDSLIGSENEVRSSLPASSSIQEQ